MSDFISPFVFLQIMEAVAEFQLANWTPVDYASIDIPGGACGLQAYDYDVQLQHHLAEYYSAASQHNSNIVAKAAKISSNDDSDDASTSRSEVRKVVDRFKADMEMMKEKMHRYPACLGAVDKSYTVPRIVAIGPYHCGMEHLKQAEEVKQVAAWQCTGTGKLLKEMYEELIPVADAAYDLYDKDAIQGVAEDDFRHMMFFDACFLVQFMLSRAGSSKIDKSLQVYLRHNRYDIFHDIMLLENQLPWMVVEAVMRFMPQPSTIPKSFVHRMRRCMMPYDHREPPEPKPFIWYEDYNPPHLLGLLRYYIVGRRCECDIDDDEEEKPEPKNMSFSASAMDLAEIGITLKANKTMQLIDMHLNRPKAGAVFTELCLAPLSLDRDRASYLVNMAAHELCAVESFGGAKEEDSAVCSYVLLLANLVYREEEVQELRERGIIQRGGGLTNEEALCFFTNFQNLRMGPRYYRIMQDIAIYRENSLIKTKIHGFLHNHKKAIAAVVTGIGAVGGIIGTLLSIKKSI